MNDVSIKLRSFSITVRDVKSLQSKMTKKENELLKRYFPKFQLGCLTDTIMDSFLSVVTTNSSTKYISCGRSVSIFQNKNHYMLGKKLLRKREFGTSKLNSVLLPVNFQDNHWILIHLVFVRDTKIAVLKGNKTYSNVTNLYLVLTR